MDSLKSDAKLLELIGIYDRATQADLALLLETAFWASLSPEEGAYHDFRISFGPPPEFGSTYLFASPRSYSSAEISDLAPALMNTQRSIGVWYSKGGGLEIWGISDITHWDITVAANRPGQVVFSMLAPENGFRLALSGSSWGVVDESRAPFYWAYLAGTQPSLIGIEEIELVGRSMMRSISYESIAKEMLAHGHGGALIIVPEDQLGWRQSCSFRYQPIEPFNELRERVDRYESEVKKSFAAGQWLMHGYFEMQRAEESTKLVAELTAVDGATILGRDLDLYGFGAKLVPLNPDSQPDNIYRSTPFEDAPYNSVKLSDLGGTRHQSAAQFVYDHRGCFAIVSSQDGRISVMHWDSQREAVVVITNLEYAL